jgi:hypothetical protein
MSQQVVNNSSIFQPINDFGKWCSIQTSNLAKELPRSRGEKWEELAKRIVFVCSIILPLLGIISMILSDCCKETVRNPPPPKTNNNGKPPQVNRDAASASKGQANREASKAADRPMTATELQESEVLFTSIETLTTEEELGTYLQLRGRVQKTDPKPLNKAIKEIYNRIVGMINALDVIANPLLEVFQKAPLAAFAPNPAPAPPTGNTGGNNPPRPVTSQAHPPKNNKNNPINQNNANAQAALGNRFKTSCKANLLEFNEVVELYQSGGNITPEKYEQYFIKTMNKLGYPEDKIYRLDTGQNKVMQEIDSYDLYKKIVDKLNIEGQLSVAAVDDKSGKPFAVLIREKGHHTAAFLQTNGNYLAPPEYAAGEKTTEPRLLSEKQWGDQPVPIKAPNFPVVDGYFTGQIPNMNTCGFDSVIFLFAALFPPVGQAPRKQI